MPAFLALGHGLYFALGGYALGMYLMRQTAGDSLPDFMRFLSWTELPWYWVGQQSFLMGLALVVLVPGMGGLYLWVLLPFAPKLKAVHFSLSRRSWCLHAGTAIFPVTETGFGGNNGLQALRPF